MENKSEFNIFSDESVNAASLGIYLWIIYNNYDLGIINRELVYKRFCYSGLKMTKKQVDRYLDELVINCYLNVENCK